MIRLSYEKGTIRIDGSVHIPFTTYDSRSRCYRAKASRYRDVVEYLEKAGIEFEDDVLNPIPCPFFEAELELRDYQQQAVERWMLGRKGCIILPTGSGKTYVALEIIKELLVPALVVVPTLDLLDQ